MSGNCCLPCWLPQTSSQRRFDPESFKGGGLPDQGDRGSVLWQEQRSKVYTLLDCPFADSAFRKMLAELGQKRSFCPSWPCEDSAYHSFILQQSHAGQDLPEAYSDGKLQPNKASAAWALLEDDRPEKSAPYWCCKRQAVSGLDQTARYNFRARQRVPAQRSRHSEDIHQVPWRNLGAASDLSGLDSPQVFRPERCTAEEEQSQDGVFYLEADGAPLPYDLFPCGIAAPCSWYLRRPYSYLRCENSCHVEDSRRTHWQRDHSSLQLERQHADLLLSGGSDSQALEDRQRGLLQQHHGKRWKVL